MKGILLALCMALAVHVGIALAAGDPDRGRTLAHRCTCHGNGDLNGKPASALLGKMLAFKQGKGGVPAMERIMKNMPEKDMEDLAAYFSAR